MVGRGPRMPSIMPAQHAFAQVPGVSLPRSVFNRSHGHKTTFDAGYLIPVLVDDIYPGDTVHCNMNFIARLTTPIKPLMDNMYLESFFFFVPYRLIWTNFVKFMGEQASPGDSISYTIPVITVPFTPQVGGLMDYLGIMPQNAGVGIVQTPTKVTALPLRAYYLLYNQWFRDENLVPPITVPLGDGPDGWSGGAVVLKRGKRHDYFTSCLPFLQKGTAVSFPFSGSALVKTSAAAGISGAQNPILLAKTADGVAATVNKALGVGSASTLSGSAAAHTGVENVYMSNLYADMSSGITALISDLRLAFQQQKFLEREARGGTRYTESVRSHFGVTSPDARLQRAEYLGGGSTPIVIAPVVQNTQKSAVPVSQTTAVAQGAANDSPLGNLSAVGIASGGGHGFVKSFTEHGVLIGIVNVRADLTYQQGLERYWSEQTRFDKYWPEFAHLSEQAVLNQEIYFGGTTALNTQDVAVFGYQERYAHLRYKPSRVSGLYRSMVATTVDVWHLAEKFAALPILAQTFIEDQTSSILARNIYVPSEPDFYFDSYFDYKHARVLPTFGVPGFADHF